jgi:hypothetical protein
MNNYLHDSKCKCNEHLHNLHIIILPITTSTEQSLSREDRHLSSQGIPRLGFNTLYRTAAYVDNDFSYLFAIAIEHKLRSNYTNYLSKTITNEFTVALRIYMQFKGTKTSMKKFGSVVTFTESSVVMQLTQFKLYAGQPYARDTCNELVLIYSIQKHFLLANILHN